MKRRKLLIHILVSIFAFVYTIGQVNAAEYVNYFGISMTNQEYDNLINLGFSEDEIYYMNEETFENNKDIESTLEVVNQKYYKTIYTDLNGGAYSTEITKNEYENQSLMDARGTVETGYKTMVSTMSKSANTFRYKVTLGWKQMPATRSYDIIGVGFNDNVYITSGVYFNYYYCDANNNCTTSTAFYDKKNISTGGSVVYKVPSSDIRALSSALYYDVAKNTSATITELNMCGDYSHATKNISGTNYTNYTVNSSGIQLYSSIINSYDEIACARSTWYGSW